MEEAEGIRAQDRKDNYFVLDGLLEQGQTLKPPGALPDLYGSGAGRTLQELLGVWEVGW